MPLIHRIINRLSPRLGNAAEVMITLLTRRGYWRSLREQRPVDGEGAPVPWLTYPALDHLSRLDFAAAAVLEYGAGQSSLWWAKRARTVVSVESRVEWVSEVRRQGPPNLTVLGPLEREEYVHAPLQGGAAFDVIVIDGVHRFECVQAAFPHLLSGGLIVVDNTDWHPRIGAWLRQQGMLQFDFHGFGPVNRYTWCTSLFVRGSTRIPYVEGPWSAGVYGSLAQRADES